MTDRHHNCFSESELFDYLLGKVNQEKALMIQSHIRQCEACLKEVDQWKELLNPVQIEQLIPSKRFKRRLTTQYVIKHFLMPRLTKPVAAVSFLAAFLIFIWFGFKFSDFNSHPIQIQFKAEEKPFKELAIVQDPHTVQYEVIPTFAREVKGYLWVNHDSKEIFLLVEGLRNIYERDYQVWMVKKDDRSNMGLIQWRNGFAHFYYQGEGLDQADNIAVSLEPKGGSIVPTGPDAIFVNINAGK
jgi:hypothetical protein